VSLRTIFGLCMQVSECLFEEGYEEGKLRMNGSDFDVPFLLEKRSEARS
jgi:hypothetical protein